MGPRLALEHGGAPHHLRGIARAAGSHGGMLKDPPGLAWIPSNLS